MKRRKLEHGDIFGRLTVLGEPYFVPDGRKNRSFVDCQCDCGTLIRVRVYDINSGNTTSCGCYQRDVTTKHALYGTPLYHIWAAIVQRCENPNNTHFKDYGGRGITICNGWRNYPVAFVEWANANGYRKGLEIDRIDNDKGYSPDNCRWVTHAENNQNRRKKGVAVDA